MNILNSIIFIYYKYERRVANMLSDILSKYKPTIAHMEIDFNYHKGALNDNFIWEAQEVNFEKIFYWVRLDFVYNTFLYNVNIEFKLNKPWKEDVDFKSAIEDDFNAQDSVIKKHLIKQIKLCEEFNWE